MMCAGRRDGEGVALGKGRRECVGLGVRVGTTTLVPESLSKGCTAEHGFDKVAPPEFPLAAAAAIALPKTVEGSTTCTNSHTACVNRPGEPNDSVAEEEEEEEADEPDDTDHAGGNNASTAVLANESRASQIELTSNM